MKSIYRYRKERHYAKPPEVIWPCVADTARINELSGSPPYQVEERMDAKGRVDRFASAGLGPFRIKWQEGFSEWEENRRLVQTRHFVNGPLRRFEAVVELHPEDAGTRVVFSSEIECAGLLCARSGKADRAPASCRVDRRPRKRSSEPRPRVKARRLPSPRTGRSVARHSPAGAGALLGRNGGRYGRTISRRTAARHCRHGLGLAVLALPRSKIKRQ